MTSIYVLRARTAYIYMYLSCGASLQESKLNVYEILREDEEESVVNLNVANRHCNSAGIRQKVEVHLEVPSFFSA